MHSIITDKSNLDFYQKLVASTSKYLTESALQLKKLKRQELQIKRLQTANLCVIPPVCDSLKDLKTSSGIYLKSGCIVRIEMKQTDAIEFCEANGMSLYAIKSIDDRDELIKWLNSINPSGSGAIYRINGINYSNRWLVNVPDQQEMLSNAIQADGNGDCLAVRFINGEFKTIRYSCVNGSIFFICEFGVAMNPTTFAYKNPPPICSSSSDLFSSSGVFLKTLCRVESQFFYADAQRNCQSNDMQLLIISSEEEKAPLYKWLDGFEIDKYYINGLFLDEWVARNPWQERIYSGGIPVGSVGDCATLTKNHQIVKSYCNQGLSYICQLNEGTPKVQASVETTLSPKDCKDDFDLYTSNNEYLKSLCLGNFDVSGNEAQMSCKSRGLELFVVSSEYELNWIKDWALTKLADGISVLVDGKFIGSKWVVRDGSEELYSGAIPTKGVGDCLRIVNDNMEIYFVRGDCGTNGYWPICEYRTTSCGEKFL